MCATEVLIHLHLNIYIWTAMPFLVTRAVISEWRSPFLIPVELASEKSRYRKRACHIKLVVVQ